ncbi:MAG: DNA methyltransferase, partial [Myxococcales bacterium]
MIGGDKALRRSLTNTGGPIEVAGDPESANLLGWALDVPPPPPPGTSHGEDPDRVHVHGFHSFPARMHPQTAARLIEPFSTSQGTVLDPFVGSGTVAVEAMLAGRRSIGIDLNPLAVALTRLKTHPGTVDDRARLLDAAEVIADGAEDRRARKAGSTKRYPPEDVEVFEPHVLLELDGLRAGIEGVESELRGALWLVLSALLVKLSKKRGDTSRELGPRRTAAGYTTKLFRKKTSELVDRLEELADALPEPCPRVRVEQDDAMRLVTVPERSGISSAVATAFSVTPAQATSASSSMSPEQSSAP